jgi:glycosyltransferase involved in cell wall biosynthesis
MNVVDRFNVDGRNNPVEPLRQCIRSDSVVAESGIRPKKVLHVLNSAGGGAALSTIGLIEALRGAGVSACAVCHDAGSSAEREQLREATDGEVLFTPLYWWNRKIRAAAWKRPLIELRQLWRTGWTRGSTAAVAEFAQRRHADLIHTNTILNPEGGIAARRLGLPHVWHLRELLGPEQPFRLRKQPPAIARYMRKYASIVVANSEISAATAAGAIPLEMMLVVPNGIELRRFSATGDDRSARHLLIVGMVASLSSRTKKHALFVEAVARLKDLNNVEFRIYGHDSTAGGTRSGDRYATEIHAMIRERGLADRFRFPGHIPDPARVMSEIDILVHPADNESFGRIVVEAMAAGLPVVGVRGGGVGEIVVDGETGLLSPTGDPAALAACISQLVRDEPLRKQLGDAGRQRAENCYSIERCAAGILRAYEEAMQRPLGNRSRSPRP